ncbi:hypothetical protein BH23GEM2_BH23GEM2_20820 [soil metagenome]
MRHAVIGERQRIQQVDAFAGISRPWNGRLSWIAVPGGVSGRVYWSDPLKSAYLREPRSTT